MKEETKTGAAEGLEALDETCCPVCGEPRQAVLRLFGENTQVKIACACERERQSREEERRRRMEERSRAEAAHRRWRESRFYRPGTERLVFAEDDAPDSEASRICRHYAARWDEMREQNCGLMLVGPVGTGKSFYAGAIMNELMDRGVSCVMVSAPQLVNLAMNGQSAELMRELDRFSLVILDDLGAERETDFSLEQLELFADARYVSGRPLIVTTNLTKAELDDRSDRRRVRILDRVREMACVPVVLTGESRRASAAQDKSQRLRRSLAAG